MRISFWIYKNKGECVSVYDDKKFFFDSLSVSGFFMILAKFVFFCQIFFSGGHFGNFEIMGNRQTQETKFKNCRKNYVLKIYILKYVLKSKMNVIFVIKVSGAFLRKLPNRPQVWPFTLTLLTKKKS